MSFLTLEDINGALFREQSFYLHTFDTSLISENSNFTDVKYDFCEISRETITGGYKFTFKVENPYWTQGYYRKPKYVSQGSYISSSIDSSGHLIIETTSKAIIVKLYMGVLQITSQNKLISKSLEKDVLNLNLKELNTTQTIRLIDIDVPTLVSSVSKDLNKGYNFIEQYGGFPVGYLLVNLLKTDFQFQCNQNVTVGKINKVRLGTLTDYLPNGDLIGTYTPNITVQYNGETLPVTFDGTDYYFNLDLTDKTTAGNIRLTVNVDDNTVLNATSTDIVLVSEFETINTFNNFKLACGDNGADIVRLGANLTATSDILVTHPIKIIGNEHSINLNGYGFRLNEDITFNVEKLQFNNANTGILQVKNTKVELTNCTFTNCTSSNYNGLGACIFCDNNIESLTIEDDYTTIITDCNFVDNSSCILHGGEISITGCTMENTDTNYVNTDNPAFLYQTDGTAIIENSNFNINYNDNSFCSNHINIGFAQSLIQIGENAQINGATHTNLQGNNTLPFFDAPYNNRSDLYVKYYYPKAETCVESVGETNGKSCCHSVSGLDWVFKDNVQVRRS